MSETGTQETMNAKALHTKLLSGFGRFDTLTRQSYVKPFSQVIIDDFDEEHKARLLQFVTGTSGVVSCVATHILQFYTIVCRRVSGTCTGLPGFTRQ